jgi:hypothetical protein
MLPADLGRECGLAARSTPPVLWLFKCPLSAEEAVASSAEEEMKMKKSLKTPDGALFEPKQWKCENCAGSLKPLAIKVDHVSHLIECQRTKIFGMISAGELEAVRFGGCTRVTMESVEALIERNRSGAPK